MTIYGIGGVSGTGKTHFRTRCRPLRDARTEDIADVYERAVAEGSPSLHWRTALNRFVHIVRRRLEADRESDIVLEAFFKRGGEQRRQLEALAAEFGIPIMWGWASAPRRECLRRLENEPSSERDSQERKNKRREFVRTADVCFFQETKDEKLEKLAEAAEAKAESMARCCS